MDLNALIPADDTLVVEIKNPITGDVLLKDDGKPMTITIYGQHSAAYKTVLHEQADKRIQKMSKQKKQTISSADVEAATLDLLSKTTKDWSIQLDGKAPKFSEAAARDLYIKLPWLRVQLIEAQEDLTGFLKV